MALTSTRMMNTSATSLKYRTNSAEFDFPFFQGVPTQCYVLATSPRCGSNFLQRALWHTGYAGAPEEYFTMPYISDFSKRWPKILSDIGPDLNVYTDLLFARRTSPNGVFGMKVHGQQLGETYFSSFDWSRRLNSPLVIQLKRQDKVAQAVSLYIAETTGIWILDGKWLPDIKNKYDEPAYNRERIMRCYQEILRQELLWENHFLLNGPPARVLFYENIVAAYEATMQSLLKLISPNPFHAKIPSPGIRKQANSRNEAWAERFRQGE